MLRQSLLFSTRVRYSVAYRGAQTRARNGVLLWKWIPCYDDSELTEALSDVTLAGGEVEVYDISGPFDRQVDVSSHGGKDNVARGDCNGGNGDPDVRDAEFDNLSR